MKIVLLSCCLLIFAVTAYAKDEKYWIKFTAKSAKGDTFLSLRANKTTTLTKECGKKVTDELGILEQHYKRGTAINDQLCTWHLHAPEGYVINIISILFVMEEGVSVPPIGLDVHSSTISLYDGAEVDPNKLLSRYHVTPQEKVGGFVQSTSSGQDMVVEIKYHDHGQFEVQKMLINYEFVNVKEMNKILQAL